jgi:beta-lactamase regulating signal transducer with metallopeptidase domain
MNLSGILDSSFCIYLTLTLGHFLWQGTVIASLAATASLGLRKASARSRHLTYVAALLLMTACLPVTFTVILATTPARALLPGETGGVCDDKDTSEQSATIAKAGMASEVGAGELPSNTIRPLAESSEPLGAPFAPPGVVTEVQPAAQPTEPATALDREGEMEAAAAPPTPASVWRMLAPFVSGAYALGVVAMLIRLFLALHGGRRLRRHSRPVDDANLLAVIAEQARLIGLRAAPVVAYCERVTVPVVVGVLHPMILLPVSLATGLSPDQLKAILTHELTHLRRYDHLVNIVQRVAESVLFFHPGVWYVSWRISVERENCCDDLVVSAGHTRHDYAESLVRAAELSLATQASGGSHSCAAVGATNGKGSRLRERILRLFDGVSHERFYPWRTWPIAAVLLAAGLIAASLLLHVRAEPVDPVPGTSSSEAAEEPSIGLYLITGRPQGIEFDKIPLADFALADEPLIRESDVFNYDWESHTIRLKERALADRIVKRKEVWDGFVVVVDGQRLYRGVLLSAVSSDAPESPVIHVGFEAEEFQPRKAVRIYPPPTLGHPDPRGDERLKAALKTLHLLARNEGNGATGLKASESGVAANVRWGAAANGLQCRLFPETQEVEPSTGDYRDMTVYLTYEVRNVSDRAVKLLPWNCPLEDISGPVFQVVDREGEAVAYRGINADRGPPAAESFVTIQPGQTLSRRAGLPYDFTRPGPYRITTTKTAAAHDNLPVYYAGDPAKAADNPDNVWTGELASNEVTVNVVPSQGPWGEPIKEGLALRLRAEPGAPANMLRADLGNKGYAAWMALASRRLFDLEVDGRKYVHSGEIEAPDVRLEPGQVLAHIAIPLDAGWLAAEPSHDPLKLSPGKHTIRIGFIAEPADRTLARPAALMSNPVEVEIVAEAGPDAVTASKARDDDEATDDKASPWGKSNAGVQARLRAEKTIWPAGETPTFLADIRNRGDGEYSFAPLLHCPIILDGQQYFLTNSLNARPAPLPTGRVNISIPLNRQEHFLTNSPGTRPVPLPAGREYSIPST